MSKRYDFRVTIEAPTLRYAMLAISQRLDNEEDLFVDDTVIECRVPDWEYLEKPVPEVDRELRALAQLTELFRLPEWRIADSAAEFIARASEILMEVSDLSVRAKTETLAQYGYGADLYGDS